jgi:hypothetical protein
MRVSPQIKKEKCLSEIINIIKKHNITVSDIVNSYIKNFQKSFSQEDRIIQYNNYLEFNNLNIFIKNNIKKNINDDYVFL